MQSSCSASLRKYSKHTRHIFRNYNQQFFETEQRRMQEPLFQDALKERMWKIEGINAEAKNRQGLKKAKYRGIEKVQIQAYMVGVVLNIKRLVVAFCYTLFRVIIALRAVNYSNLINSQQF